MTRKKAVWTVMVYLAGDNNLTSECLFALTEMKKANPDGRINVISQFDPRDEYLPTHRYEINRNGPQTSLSDDIIDEGKYEPKTREIRFHTESQRSRSLGTSRHNRAERVARVIQGAADLSVLSFEEEKITDDTDTGSPVTLYNFLSFCIEEYPAEHYMVVLSGHAGGIESDYLMKDESSRGSLTFNEMKRVFKELKNDLSGQRLDIIGMDNCLMSMGEISYELRDSAQIVIGCESYSPASGWPYRQILERMQQELNDYKNVKESLPAKTAKGIVEEYVNYYSNYWLAGLSVSQSALDVTRIEEFRKLVDELADELESGLVKEYQKNSQSRAEGPKPFHDAVVLAHWEAQSYNGESFVDVYDLCSCLEKRLPRGPSVEKCQKLKKFIESEFVLKSCFSGAAHQFSYGVSIYFPWAHVAPNYGNLDFIKESNGSGWGSFLRAYTLITRRLPRGVEGASDKRVGRGFGGDMDRMAVDRMAADRMAVDRMAAGRMAADRMAADRMAADRMAADRMAVDRMAADRMAVDRMAADRMAADRMFSGVGSNPIRSMRNPPIDFFPSECLRERREIVAAQERLRV